MGGEKMNFVERFKMYLKDERNMSNHTVDGYIRDVERFLRFVNKDIESVEPDDISNFISFLKRNGMEVASTNRALSAIKTFYKFMIKKKLIKVNPAAIVESGKMEKRLPKPVDYENIIKLINIADNLRDKIIFELLYACGARRSELVNIKVSDINFHRKCVRLFGKGQKERIVPLYDGILNRIKELISTQNSKWLFPSVKVPGNHLSNRRLNEIVSYWVSKAGLDGMDITPHKFRHALATNLYERGADIRAIQDMLGHVSINTTNLYTRVCVERNRAEYEKLFERVGV